MKLIHPVAYQLSMAEDRIKALEKENHELRLEVARLTGQEVQQSMTRQTESSNRYRSSTSEQMLPSYARSTKTSRLRSSPVSASSPTTFLPSIDQSPRMPIRTTNVSINRKTCSYKDGNLDVMSFGYLKSTTATHHRDLVSLVARLRLGLAQPKVQKTNNVEKTNASGQNDGRDQSYYASWDEELERPRDPEPASTLQIMTKTEWDDMVAQKAITIRTRLADKAWTNDSVHTGTVFINHDALFDILSAAESLAKRCLWGWTRTHQPEHCQYGLGYRSDVDFGRQRLGHWLETLPGDFFDYRYTPPWKVFNKLHRVIDLRNFLHHFNGRRRFVCDMDSYVENVQELAVLLYDEKAASQARALRDRLRGEAEQTLGEIETLMMLTSLPEAGAPWKPHHADLIQMVASESEYALPSYHPIVRAAVREWKSHRRTWNYGVTQPELEEMTEGSCSISHRPGLPTATDSQQDAAIVGDSPTKSMCTRRRGSVSGETGHTMPLVGGPAEVGVRRRAASMCYRM